MFVYFVRFFFGSIFRLIIFNDVSCDNGSTLAGVGDFSIYFFFNFLFKHVDGFAVFICVFF